MLLSPNHVGRCKYSTPAGPRLLLPPISNSPLDTQPSSGCNYRCLLDTQTVSKAQNVARGSPPEAAGPPIHSTCAYTLYLRRYTLLVPVREAHQRTSATFPSPRLIPTTPHASYPPLQAARPKQPLPYIWTPVLIASPAHLLGGCTATELASKQHSTRRTSRDNAT